MQKNNSTEMALIIFAREPKDGKVKTRLLKDLSVRKVTSLYKTFIRDVTNIAKHVRGAQRFLYYVGVGFSIPFLRQFQGKFILKRQMGQDLGQRMHRAFVYCQSKGFAKMIIIGTDCLTITPQDIEKAYRKLDHHDCVIGPAKDGGYYLIGLKIPDQRLFSNIKWSSAVVLEQTLKKLTKHKKTVYCLSKHEDIDTIDALRRFEKHSRSVHLLLA